MNLTNNPLMNSLNNDEFKKSLKSAHIPITSEDYLLLVIFGTVLVGLVLILLILLNFLLNINLNPIPFLDPVISMAIVFLVIVGTVFALAYTYPQMECSGRKTRIEFDLPYAVTYMQALSTTMTLFSIFKSVAENYDLYGEVSEECAMIVRDVEYFGDDLMVAMRNVQSITPSENFSELLNDLAMVFKTGGSMTDFFASKSEHYRETALQELDNTLKTMEIMAEIYVTAFVAGPIAIMIMIVAQNLSGQSTVDFLAPLMYIGLPIGATAMVFLLYIMMPPDTLTISRKALPQAEYSDTNIDPGSMMLVDEKFMKNFESHRNLLRIREILRNPMKYYVSDYQYGAVFGVILACIVALLFFNGTLAKLIPTYTLEAFISLFVIMFMFPVAVAYEARNHYLKKFESQLPAFLREISDMKDMGMTLQSAIHIIANSKIGVLTREVKITSTEIKMGTSVSLALYKLEERIGLVSVKRAISLVIKASEITDHLHEILAIAIGDLEHFLKMKNERFGVSFVYVAIIYLSLGIFLYSAYQLNVTFIESFSEFNLNFNVASNVGEMFHISIILALFSGLMAGQLSANNILAGLKHSIIFLLATGVLFIYII
ncbi:MAG: type II secretion system F family protein [Methanomicrobium sp.]|nr:type II secretion system F family protein [Methanomicrobium sp.]